MLPGWKRRIVKGLGKLVKRGKITYEEKERIQGIAENSETFGKFEAELDQEQRAML